MELFLLMFIHMDFFLQFRLDLQQKYTVYSMRL